MMPIEGKLQKVNARRSSLSADGCTKTGKGRAAVVTEARAPMVMLVGGCDEMSEQMKWKEPQHMELNSPVKKRSRNGPKINEKLTLSLSKNSEQRIV
jgi:hypothetical protein